MHFKAMEIRVTSSSAFVPLQNLLNNHGYYFSEIDFHGNLQATLGYSVGKLTFMRFSNMKKSS